MKTVPLRILLLPEFQWEDTELPCKHVTRSRQMVSVFPNISSGQAYESLHWIIPTILPTSIRPLEEAPGKVLWKDLAPSHDANVQN